jgi:hypothetical protein
MPNGNQSLLSFTDIFSELGMDDKYLSLIQDPTKYFGLGQEYKKFFPGAEMYQQQLSTLLGTGEGSIAEREATLSGQVQQQYGLGRQKAGTMGTQSLLGLGQQFRQQQAKSGFGGSGALQAAYGTGQQQVGREYGQQLGMLGEQRERGMFGVEEDISGLRGQAQSLWGQYIESMFGIGRDIWASMPDPEDKEEYAFKKTTEYDRPGPDDPGPPGWPDAAAYERWRAAGSDPAGAVAYGWKSPFPGATPGYKPGE